MTLLVLFAILALGGGVLGWRVGLYGGTVFGLWVFGVTVWVLLGRHHIGG